MARSFQELVAEGWKPWWRYEFPYAFRVLYGRLKNRRPRPIFRGKIMWQRARRGWSDADVWGFHNYLEDVISSGVAHMREIAHGHPMDLTFEEWTQILLEIEQGMAAAQRYAEYGEWDEQSKEQFERGMDHLKRWWFDLWD